MFNVNSKKAVFKLANRSFKGNRTRNLIAITAIALTAVLFTALFTVGSGMVENIQRQTMRMAGGDGMGILKYVTEEEYEQVKDHELIEEISYNRLMCGKINNDVLIKRHGELYYMDDTGIKLAFAEPAYGHKPEAANEIMMDRKTVRLLGMEEKVGTPVILNMVVHGEEVEREFVLSGWWEADPAFNVSIMVTSKAYMEAHRDELYNSYKTDGDVTGVINCYIMFKNSFNLEDKVSRVITESGYSMDENDPNYMESNVNWSYMSTDFNMDLPTVSGVVLALLLIAFAGYLIIYNIFQISVIRDIRFYGLLKTIGTTGKQIRKVIRFQALYLSGIGIPIGLALGYATGCSIVPLIMEFSSYGQMPDYQTKPNPFIFIVSMVFAFATVFISTAKPGHIAAGVSPVEAVSYTESMDMDRKTHKNKKGEKVGRNVRKKQRDIRRSAKISDMAAANLGRSKKRTVLVVVSMALSLVLFNTIYTFSRCFDMDKFLSRFVDTDFLIAHAAYFNYEYLGPDNALTESMVEAVMAQPGFEEGGRIYADPRGVEVLREEIEGIGEGEDGNGNVFCIVYGMEDLPLDRQTVLEGEIDIEKLKTGKYILEGVGVGDNDEPLWETSTHEIGDIVTLHNYKGDGETIAENEYMTYQFEVMAKVAVRTFTNSAGWGDDRTFYLPAQVYKGMVSNPGLMSYVYNVEDEEEAAMDAFLENYTQQTEPFMNYSSKMTRVAQFEGMRNMIIIVGGTLSLVIGLIGVLNFVNSVLTSILTRRRELAMLQSVGMTTKQLRRMLVLEGLYYTAAAGCASLILGILLSLTVVRAMAGGMWFFSYRFTVWPLCMTIPVLLLIGSILPAAVLRVVEKQSIVERLREAE